CIAHPAGIETHIDDRLLHFRQAPAVAIVEQETPLGTASVLTEITLGTAGRFAAFYDLITLTVRAADGDECHGPFLPMRSYEDEAQCDVHLSPSPLLKHCPPPEDLAQERQRFATHRWRFRLQSRSLRQTQAQFDQLRQRGQALQATVNGGFLRYV